MAEPTTPSESITAVDGAASANPVAAPTLNLSLTGIWHRFQHHKVMHWTLAYAAAAYTLLHGVEMLSAAQEWPHAIVKVLSLVLLLGVPVVMTLAWYHGAKGLQRVSGPELVIITFLGVIAGTVLWRFTGRSEATIKTVAVASQTTTTAVPRTSVAVLPFANLTGDASKEYLGDGMAEELINTLNKVPGLKVPARTSTFAYKGRNTDIRQIARDLGVGTVLEGSVRAAGKRIRITAQLINAQDGLHLWSESYDEEFTDIFKLQDKLARAIAGALLPSLNGTALTSVVQAAPPTQDVEAYNLYLRGVSLVQRTSSENAARAIDYFQQALARDPDFARAYAMIAEAHMGWGAIDHTFEHFTAAERAALQALALDSSLYNAHNALAGATAARGQLLDMEAHGRAALSFAPTDGYVQAVRGITVGLTGRMREALDAGHKGYTLAPANPFVLAYLAFFESLSGRDAEALKYAAAARELAFPAKSVPLPIVYELAALRARRYLEAAKFASEALNGADPNQARTAEVSRRVYAALADPGLRSAAIAARQRLYPKAVQSGIANGTLNNLDPCLQSSLAYGFIGAVDTAYELANQCLDQAAPGAIDHFLALNRLWIPELSQFRADPRFQALATRLRYMEYWQQYGLPDDCSWKAGTLTCH
jgi:TolB-like protein